MRVNGVVERVEQAYAWVDVSVAQGCGRCDEPGGCGGVNIARPFGSGRRSVKVLNSIEARPGEAVGVEVDDRVPLRAALRVYALPVLGVLGGAAFGTAFAPPGSGDLAASLGAAAGFLLAVFAGRRFHAAGAARAGTPLRLVRAAGSGECGK